MPRATAPAPLAAPPLHARRIQPHRLLQFDLIARVAIIVASSITCLLAWFVPTSLTAQLIIEGGMMGRVVLYLLTVCSLVGALDILVNDLLPDPWHCRWAKRNQHRGYAIIAAMYLLQAYASIGNTLGVEDLLAVAYIVNAVLAAWYAWTTSVRGWHV